MLPVRLETRRIDNDICIRVFPDQPFVDGHQEKLTQEEHDHAIELERLLEFAGDSQVPSDVQAARDEWLELARRYGPHRAAWILQSVINESDAAFASTASDFVPRLFLLPERFFFYIYKEKGQLAYTKEGARVCEGLTLLPARGASEQKKPPKDALFDASSKWVRDFDSAIDVGLGVKIPLSDQDRSAPELKFEQILAVGLRSLNPQDGVQAFNTFVRSHHYTDGVEFIEYGTPTNNTSTSVSAHSESEEDLRNSFDYEMRSPLLGLAPGRVEVSAATRLARHVGLLSDFSCLKNIRGAARPLNADFSKVVDALWPSTGDYFFATMLGLEKNGSARAMLQKYAARYLRPRGALSALRIGNLPYGVLPVSRIRPATAEDRWGWKTSPIDRGRTEDQFKGADWSTFDSTFFSALSVLLNLWIGRATAVNAVPRIGEDADVDAELLKVLAMSPHSLTHRTRPIVGQALIGFLLLLFRPSRFGPSSSFGAIADPNAAMDAWLAEKQRITTATLDVLTAMGCDANVKDAPLLNAFAWGDGAPLHMPLVRGSNGDGPEAYVPVLRQLGANATGAQSDTLLYDLLRRSFELAGQLPSDFPALADALTALDDYPVLEFFNEEVSPARLVGIISQNPPPPTILDESEVRTLASDLTTARDGLNVGTFTSLAQVQGVFETYQGGSNVFQNVVNKLRMSFSERLEAVLLDVIDALTFRLDAWFSTLALRRLEAMRDRNQSGLLWGAYGYVENVLFPAATTARGKPDTGGGFIHAPSVGQANAAAMLRSAFDTHRSDASGNAFSLDLTSNRVRRAGALIEGVRQGQDLSALLGYQFERGLHDAGLDRLVDDFRAIFPFPPPESDESDEQRDETGGEGGGAVEAVPARSVCDGRRLADAYQATSDFREFAEIQSTLTQLASSSHAALHELLHGVKDARDAVGDLLLFEGVFQAAQGNYERAGAALDACAGIGVPPEIESVSTPVSSTTLRHRICLLLRGNVASDPSIPGPRAAAEPRLNAWVTSLLGDPTAIGCRTTFTPVPQASPEMTVTIYDLQLSALDFMYMCASTPTGDGDTEIEVRIRRYVRSTGVAASDSGIQIALGSTNDGMLSIADAMEIGRALLDVLGSSSVLTPAALMHPDEAPGAVTVSVETPRPKFCPDAFIASIKESCRAAHYLLGDQPAILRSRNVSDIRTALDVCAGFGIQEALFEVEDDTAILNRAARVSPIVDKRVANAKPFINGVADDGGDERIGPLTKAFKALFGDSFVVLPPIDARVLSGRGAVFDGSTVASEPAADRVWLWLQQVADTHPRVRKLETFLMYAEATGQLRQSVDHAVVRVAQLPARTEYGWQALSDAELAGTKGRTKGCQSIVAIVPEDIASGGTSYVTGFLVDEWTEPMPFAHVTTGISFEYNQPNQQAPHCFLLAVPGNFEAGPSWTPEHLAAIVRDTVDLAKIRLVDLDAFPAVAGVFPSLLFPISPSLPKFKLDALPLAGPVTGGILGAGRRSMEWSDAVPSAS